VIGFRESIFVYDAHWLREFGDLYRREINLPYYCHVRGDMMTEEMVDLLAWSPFATTCSSDRLLRQKSVEYVSTISNRNLAHRERRASRQCSVEVREQLPAA